MKPVATIPTLLVFTLGPENERSRRRLLPTPLGRAETALHRSGLERMLAIGHAAGCRVVVAAPEPLDLPAGVTQLLQRGSSFGMRLRDAVCKQRTAIGDAPLLVVGTDTPDLEAAHLLAAIGRLADDCDSVVVGPSVDGGFYLLACRIGVDEALAAVHWRRRDACRSLLTALHRAGHPVHLLEELLDLDHRADLERWLTRRRTGTPVSWLERWLWTVLAAWRRPVVQLVFGCPDLALAAVVFGRGPPC